MVEEDGDETRRGRRRDIFIILKLKEKKLTHVRLMIWMEHGLSLFLRF